jgi:hypothetical protein
MKLTWTRFLVTFSFEPALNMVTKKLSTTSSTVGVSERKIIKHRDRISNTFSMKKEKRNLKKSWIL